MWHVMGCAAGVWRGSPQLALLHNLPSQLLRAAACTLQPYCVRAADALTGRE